VDEKLERDSTLYFGFCKSIAIRFAGEWISTDFPKLIDESIAADFLCRLAKISEDSTS